MKPDVRLVDYAAKGWTKYIKFGTINKTPIYTDKKFVYKRFWLLFKKKIGYIEYGIVIFYKTLKKGSIFKMEYNNE